MSQDVTANAKLASGESTQYELTERERREKIEEVRKDTF
jgi:hypothetical protein